VEALTPFELLSPADFAAVEAAVGLFRIVRDDVSGPTGPSELGPAAYLPFGGGTPEAPRVGDVRLRDEFVPAGSVSAVARKSGDRLEPFPTRSGVALALARSGVHGPDALFAEVVARNGALTLVRDHEGSDAALEVSVLRDNRVDVVHGE